MSGKFSVTWYGATDSIATTRFMFTAEEASKVAQQGAEAPDFWEWAATQEFQIDDTTDAADLPVVRADAELSLDDDNQADEFTAWKAPPANHGHVMVNLRIDVSDAAALIEAGRRSVARDLSTWMPHFPAPITFECREIITEPAQAVVDLLVEAWARCYRGYTAHPAFIEVIDCAEWGDVDNKEWYPSEKETPNG